MDLFLTKVAYAAVNVDSVISKANIYIINPLINLLFALAIVYFLYGVFEFLSNSDNEEAKTTGKSHMLWGVVGITIMMGVWVILRLVINTFGLNDQIIITNPNNNGTVDVKLK